MSIADSTGHAGIRYVRRGSGEPLVLIHGLGGSSRIWRPVLDRLSSARDVIAVDLPGFGGSPPLHADRATPDALARSIRGLCDKLGIERPHVAGNSLGGWVALELGRNDAASVAAISPAGLWRQPLGPVRFDTRRVGRLVRPLIRGLLRTRRGHDILLRSTAAHPERIPMADARGLVLDWLGAPGYEAPNREMRAAVLRRPEEISVPVTILWGNRDHIVAPPRPERTPPNAVFVVLEDCGHTPTWDEPELVADMLLEASSGAGIWAPAKATHQEAVGHKVPDAD
jgi:pimeloyl-ACP methyl ester carboxylesterase